MSPYTYKKRRPRSRPKSTIPSEAESVGAIAHILGAAAFFGALCILPRLLSVSPKNAGAEK